MARGTKTTADAAAAPLGTRFWRLWGASTLSGLGDGLSLVAFPLLVTSLTRTPQWVAGILVAQRLPWLLLSLHAGALADRLDRRRLLGLVEVMRMAVLLLLGVSVATHTLTLPLLYGAAATMGGLETLFSAASHAALPALVDHDQLPRANGYLQSAQIAGAQVVGPAFGGLLFAAAAALPFIFDGVSFLGSAALLVLALPRMARSREAAAAPTTSLGTDVMEGVRWFLGNPLLRLLATVVGVLAFCWAMVTAVTVLYALEVLHLSGRGYGLFMAAGAIGQVGGGIVASRVQAKVGTAAVIIGGAVAASVAYLAIGTTAAVVVATLATILETSGIGIANVATMSLRQGAVPPELLGRVGNAFRMCIFGAAPLGALAGGFLAHASLQAPFLVAAVIQLVMLALCGPALVARIRASEAAVAVEAVGTVAGAPGPVPVLDLTEPDVEELELVS